MKAGLVSLTVAASLLAAGVQANAITDSVDDSMVVAGDAIQILLPATGLFAAWMHDDAEGAKQLAYSTLSAQLAIHGLKKGVGRRRPNDSSWNSFPSGHTGAAFSGAAFLQSRYGSAWGIPAYAAATFVGYSRMHGNRHFAGDVIAGAGIAFLTNQYFVSPHRADGVYFNAMPTADGFAVGMTVTNQAFEPTGGKGSRAVMQHQGAKKNRFELGMGFNLADSAGHFGARSYLEGTGAVDKYQPFAYINYQRDLENGNFLELEFNPNETRRRGEVSRNFSLDGHEYKTGEDVYAQFRHWMLGASLYKNVYDGDALKLDVGLGGYLHMVSVGVDKEQGGQYADSTTWSFLPSLTAQARYMLTDDLYLSGSGQAQYWDDNSYFNVDAGVGYQLSPNWEAGLKYTYIKSKLDNNLVDKTNYDGRSIVLSISTRF